MFVVTKKFCSGSSVLLAFELPYFFLEKKVGKNSRRFDASVFPWLLCTPWERQNVVP
jgi:hypothetical protein